tara:strand:+ start:16370 stop:17944 length:1575 start_codon:yes stop_codon:yes gene_type:complete
MKKIYHIDCTLRDGGYYNSWNFEEKVVKKYLECMNNLNIDYVEIGFRFLKDSQNLGQFASTTEKIISKYKIPKKMKLAVMINIGEFSLKKLKFDLDKKFTSRSRSKVSLVRIATHQNEIDLAIEAAKILKKKGYLTAINLMQISEINLDKIKKICGKLKKNFLDFFYFADSLGSLTDSQTKAICLTIKKNWRGPFGIHAHDNTEIALFNTIVSLQNGASFADSTVLGMGRGPGNVKTELLCSYLNSIRVKKYNLVFLTDIVDKYFSDLKKKYGWGTNLYYYLSAKYKIHPTYIQYMLADKRYEDNEIILAIENLKKQKSKIYNPDILKNSKNFFKNNYSKNVYSNNFRNKKILILANGNSLNIYKNKINNFIRKYNPIIISLNNIQSYNIKKKINYIAICHPTRIMSEIKSINKNIKLITPFSSLQKELQIILKNHKMINYGLIIDKKDNKMLNDYCVLDKPLVLPYVLSFLIISNVKSINFAGLDGYENNSIMRKEHNKILDKFKKMNPEKIFKFLTPTKYKI